jgi:aspartate racemase
MKTIGLIGGLTWLSSLDYYRLLNKFTNDKLGGVEAARIILYSVNFAEIKTLTEEGRWEEIESLIGGVAKKLEEAGADCILIGANTMHNIADGIQQRLSIPVIHIAEEVGKEIGKKGLAKVALLGTKYTMQMDFYKTRLANLGISTIIPSEKDIELINTSIYSEMSKGIFRYETKTQFLSIINGLVRQGAEGVILGCTEIPILISQDDCQVPVFDSTQIHSRAAVNFALAEPQPAI